MNGRGIIVKEYVIVNMQKFEEKRNRDGHICDYVLRVGVKNKRMVMIDQ